MKSLVDALAIAELVMFVGLAVVAVVIWRQRGGAARAWIALTFGNLAVVLAFARLIPKGEVTGGALWATKVLVAFLVLFPYLLYRFATTFRRPSAAVQAVISALTIFAVFGVFLLERLPQPGE